MRLRSIVIGDLASAFLIELAAIPNLATAGCSSSGLYQGDEYTPNGTIAIAPASERTDAACGGDGASSVESGAAASGCADANADVVLIPLPDGSTEPSNTCASARSIGTISGDTTTSSSTTAKGTCSEWLTLRATEDDSSALGAAMKVTITLTPVGGDFELYAYFSPDRSDLSVCTIPPFASSFATGTTTETITLQWGEGSVANGSDEGRTIAIAVVKVAGPCTPATTWSLIAEH